MLAVATLLTTSACAPDAGQTDPPLESVSFENVPIDQVRELPPSEAFVNGRLGPTGGTIFEPSSAAVEQAVAYRFTWGTAG